MNFCTICKSQYVKPGTCNCYATTTPRKVEDDNPGFAPYRPDTWPWQPTVEPWSWGRYPGTPPNGTITLTNSSAHA